MAVAGSQAVGELLRRAVVAGLAPGFVGLAVGAQGDGLCWSEGKAALGGEAVTPGTWYDLASLTKPLATTTLTLLARRDGLDLEAPLGDLLPELAQGPWGRVTVAQVLTHTAGFPAWAPLYLDGLGRDAYLRALDLVLPHARAGKQTVYSCLGFMALGMALERAGGADLATLFTELVAEPLGLADELSFAPPEDTPLAAGELEPFVEQALVARQGIKGGPPRILSGVASCDDGNARGLGGAAGNAGLFGTVAAIAQLGAEYLPGGGALLSPSEAELATRCWTSGLEQARSLGWQLAATPGCSAGPGLSPEAFGHTGFTGTALWVDPSNRTVTVLLSNRLHPGGRTPDLGPLRRRFNREARHALFAASGAA
jgi:CubicO group peptidase (beta-lactamase class C family)